ncbi:MAG: YidC/Oxa1 family membrane protein insertase, partial [Synergistaceae bacterium]|nr:YidC/Oxa1 family membrane protein insertase [Synergistaceae bacterium]
MGPLIYAVYTVCVYPFEAALRYAYSAISAAAGSYGLSLVVLSLCVTVAIAPLMKGANAEQVREKRVQNVLRPQIERITSECSGAQRQRRIENLYRRYAYHPIYSIRSGMGILIQVPFLFGAYYMLRGYGGISGIPFL